MKRITTFILAALTAISVSAQQDIIKQLDNYFKGYRTTGQRIRSNAHLQSLEINDSLRTIEVCADSHLGEACFTPEAVDHIYNNVLGLMPDSCQDYQLSIKTGGWELRQLVPPRLLSTPEPSRDWGNINYEGQPWVKNASLPYTITNGLQNRHLCVWASHGIYFHIADSIWRWQRPPLFGTREDLFTQTIVVPYLIPMLERAGAIVFTPRERDWQRHEVIVDNDTPRSNRGIYQETQSIHHWEKADSAGFAFHDGVYFDGENPFLAGTVRQVKTVEHARHESLATYLPTIPEAGRYAVYVSYQPYGTKVSPPSSV